MGYYFISQIDSRPITHRSQDKGISPPLKLKIKFGKDKTGAITHGKIKTKHSPSSGEEKEETTKTSSKRFLKC